MTCVKLKIGNNKQVWLFDSGATDLFINKETEEELKKEGIINKKISSELVNMKWQMELLTPAANML